MTDITIGQTVRLNENGVEGTVRFVGETAFAHGPWVGVELATADGKNDGSIQNQRYFECEMGRGMFLRPTALTVISHQQPLKFKKDVKKAVPPNNVTSTLGRRPSNMSDPVAVKQMNLKLSGSSTNLTRRSGSQTSSTFSSPTKSPDKQPSGAMSLISTLKTGTYSNSRTASASSKSRQSTSKTRNPMPPPPRPVIPTPRRSIGGSESQKNTVLNKVLTSKQTAPSKPSSLVGQTIHSASNQFNNLSSADIGDDLIESHVTCEGVSPTSISPALSRNTPATRPHAIQPDNPQKATSPVAQRSTSINTVVTRSVEDLKTKIRIMDKKAIENRDKLKVLDKVQEENEKFRDIIQKMQSKYQSQQQEILGLRIQLKEAEEKLELAETNQVEHELAMEMATLDREVAEETAEVLKSELDTIKLKNEELELEVEILKVENTELGTEMSPEEKDSKGWIHMQKNNERMREALIRLRDITQQTEIELRDEIKSLQEDLNNFRNIKEKYEATKQKLTQSNEVIEDLKQQLDSAMGAEDMIEELTEKNVSLQEQLDELRVTIADYETLKEISDEVEINHVEIEKEMQSEIDTKESIILEQKRKVAQQEQVISDMEYTLLRFRDLTTNLQGDLDDMRASHTLTETEGEELSNRSRAILDLNRKLHVLAVNTQVKTIDLELRRLDAQEASEHLAIVQLFLPETFNIDRDSILALLRFKRVGFKARLLLRFVKERINTQPSSGYEDSIFAACDVLNKLSWVAAICDCFTSAISRSTFNEFVRYESALYELEPVERALNGWIDGLRRDELKETRCASELQRTMALMSHLAEVHMSSSLESYADKIYMQSVVMLSQLENSAITMTFVKQMVESIVPNQEDNDESAQRFSRKFEIVISQTRHAKVIIGKIVKALEELNSRSLSLTPDSLQFFENCKIISEEIAKFSRYIGDNLYQLLYVEGRSELFTYNEVEEVSHQTTLDVFEQSETDLFSVYLNKARILTNLLIDLATLTSDLEITQEFEKPQTPWILRSQELKLSKVTSVDVEDEVRRLKEQLHERARIIALKDQTLEEVLVKVELLESRMKDATKKAEQLTELERRIEESRKHESDLMGLLKSQSNEISSLEADREGWKKMAEEMKALSTKSPQVGQEPSVTTAQEISLLSEEIKNLQAAVRYLSKEINGTKFIDSNYMDWIEKPLIKPVSREKQRQAIVFSEGRQILSELLNLSINAKLYDLKVSDSNKSSWRPAKSTPQYYVARQREDFESWRSWKDDLILRASTIKQCNLKKKLVQKPEIPGKWVAQVSLFLPGWENKIVRPEKVTIIEPDQFDIFKETLGFV